MKRSFDTYYALVDKSVSAQNSDILDVYFCGNCINFDIKTGKCSDYRACVEYFFRHAGGNNGRLELGTGKGVFLHTPYLQGTGKERKKVIDAFKKMKLEYAR